MKFNGALVKTEKDRVIGVAVVEENFRDLSAEERADLTMKYMKGFGVRVPVVMLLVSEDGQTEQFFGRPDLIPLVSDIPLNMMTFKTYEYKEDAEA